MKRTNSIFVVARLMLLVLTLVITVFTFASCEGLPPELQGILGGNNNSSCEHTYDNACDTDCNECGTTRTTEHTYDNACDTDCNICGVTRETEHTYADGVCSVCGAADESVPTCEHTNIENCVCQDCGATAHTAMQWHAAFPPTCTINGSNTDLYFCYDCHMAFMDEDGTIEAIHEDVVIPAPGHNYVNNVCDRCGYCKHLTIENCVCKDCGATVHDFPFIDVPMFMPASAPTCDKNGNIDYYYCIGCYQAFSDADGKNKLNYSDFIIPALGHDYVDGACERCGAIECKHTTVENCVCKDCNATVHTDIECIPAMAPSCYNMGIRFNIYGCNDCGKGYSDAECKNEITDLNDAIIPPLGHKNVGDVCERCGSFLVGQGESAPHPNPTPWISANEYLYNLYRGDDRKITNSDYELISKVVIEDVEFTVTWTIVNESITLRYDEANGVYVVDIPDEITKNCYYSIEATIYNSETERSVKYLFIRLLEKNASAHQHPGVENCVCNSCNETVHNIEFVSAKAPTCEDFGNVEFYICMDCNKLFSDADAKNEITESVVIPALGGEHNYVDGTCDKCGSSDPFGGAGDSQGGAPENPSEP